jgi:hypothetical protein
VKDGSVVSEHVGGLNFWDGLGVYKKETRQINGLKWSILTVWLDSLFELLVIDLTAGVFLLMNDSLSTGYTNDNEFD